MFLDGLSFLALMILHRKSFIDSKAEKTEVSSKYESVSDNRSSGVLLRVRLISTSSDHHLSRNLLEQKDPDSIYQKAFIGTSINQSSLSTFDYTGNFNANSARTSCERGDTQNGMDPQNP